MRALLIFTIITTLLFTPLLGEKKADTSQTAYFSSDDALIVLDEEDHFLDVNIPALIKKRHVIINLYSEGAYSLGEVKIPYIRGLEKVKHIKAKTILPNGKEIKVKDIWDKELFEGISSLSDLRAKGFVFPQLTPGCTIEYEFEIESHLPVSELWVFTNEYPTLKSKFSLTFPALLTIDYILKNGAPEPHKSGPFTIGGLTYWKYAWEMDSLLPIPDEPYSPPLNQVAPTVYYSPTGIYGVSLKFTWDDLVKVLRKFYDPILKPDDKISSLANKLTEGINDTLQKAIKFYDFTRCSVRYVAVELGLGSWIPTKPSEVLKVKWGDCKDKSALLISLCRSQGIRADMVLLKTIDNGNILKSFPSLQFNHAIVRILVGNIPYYVDPTERYAPFGILSPNLYGAEGIVMEEQDWKFTKLPGITPLGNFTSEKIEGTLSSSGKLDASFEVVKRGYDMVITSEIINKLNIKDNKKITKSFLKDSYTDVDVEGITLTGLEGTDSMFTVRSHLIIPSFATVAREVYVLKASPFRFEVPNLPEGERKTPIVFNYPETRELKIKLVFPTPILSKDSLDIVLFRDWGRYERRVKVKGDTLTVKHKFVLKRTRFKKERYHELIDDFNKVKKYMNSNIVLLQKTE